MVPKRPDLPSRRLIALFVATTVAPLGVLLWVGWRLVEQDRLLEAQQAQQRVERAADLAVAALQRALSASEQRLAADEKTWPEGAVALFMSGARVDAAPQGRLAFLPILEPRPETPVGTLARGQELEFRQRDRAAAAAFYRGLARSSDEAVRAAALIGLARNLQAAGRIDEAFDAYSTLADQHDTSIGGVPAVLVARYARGRLFELRADPDRLRLEGEQLARDLRSVGSMLTRPVYWLYATDAARWSDQAVQPARASRAHPGADAAGGPGR